MRFGVIYFPESANLGDDIQSFAALRFLPQVDCFINREALDSFSPDNEEQIAVIMNGWFLYQHYNWPPSPYIVPLLTSMHFDTFYSWQYQRRMTGNYVFDGLGREYLQRYGPVGCRDLHTLKMAQNNGIDAYFSGCLTLCIRPFENVKREDYICLVDVPESLELKVRLITKRPIKIMTHYLELKNLSAQERMARVESYLRIYQGAHCVITSRLHCALPCLAMETPVCFAYSSWMQDRVESYLPYLYHINDAQINADCNIQELYDLEDPPENPIYYKQYQKTLIDTCENFVRTVEARTENIIPSKEIRCSYLKRMSYLKDILGKEIEQSESFKATHNKEMQECTELATLILVELRTLTGKCEEKQEDTDGQAILIRKLDNIKANVSCIQDVFFCFCTLQESLYKKNQELESKYQDMQKNNEQLNITMKNQQIDKMDLSNKLKSAQGEISNMTDEKQKLKHKNLELSNMLRQKAENFLELEKKKMELQDEKNTIADELEKIHDSKFWKIANKWYAFEGFFIRLFRRIVR